MVVVTVVMDLLPQSLHAVLFDAEADEHFLTLASSYRNLSGGGRARNRRRKSIAISIYDHLIGRLTDHSELLDLVQARRAEVLSPDFEATQSTCLFNASEPAQAAAPVEVAAPVTPPIDAPGAVIVDFLEEESPERSRSPISASAILSSTPKPPGPRPRVGGIRTPVPPAPRSKHLGVRTPIPPIAGREAPPGGYLVVRPKKRPLKPQDSEGEDSEGSYLRDYPTITESFRDQGRAEPESNNISDWTAEQWRAHNAKQEPASSSSAPAAVAPAILMDPPLMDPPRELCKLHNATTGLGEVLIWLTQAFGLGYRYILSLDQHKVADRSVLQTRELLQAATRERTLVCVLSFIPKNSYESHGNHALELWRGVVSSCADYPLKPLPLIVTPKPLGPWGKAATLRWLSEKLWSEHDQASWALWTHVDDREDICEEFGAEESIKAVHWHVRDRRSLLTLCREEGAL